MRGVSPVVSFVLLITIIVVSAMGLYYWVAGSVSQQELTPVNIDVQVHKYNSTVIKVTNAGVVNSTVLTELESSAGNCSFAASTVLVPGVTYSCVFPASVSGELTVWAGGVNTVFVYM